MSDFIIFTVDNSSYALEVSKIERIDQVPALTALPNAHPIIDGMMMYQNHTAKVVNFRKMTNVVSHEEELTTLFNLVIKDHNLWVETLKNSILNAEPFLLALDPHECRLGKWLYSYTTHDPDVLAILRRLIPIHAKLHLVGEELLGQARDGDVEGAMKRYEEEIINDILVATMKELSIMLERTHDLSSHSQKLLIYRTKDGFFALKVDSIRDITVFDDKQIKPYSHTVKVGSYLNTRGVVEYKNSLVIVIDSVDLPEDEAA